MEVIVHRIRLLPGTDPEGFEAWVRAVDYATCPQLPSLLRFGVHRVPRGDVASAPFHYFEIIEVSSGEAFERDMKTEVFAGLVREFERMAEVVDEFTGRRLNPGYQNGLISGFTIGEDSANTAS